MVKIISISIAKVLILAFLLFKPLLTQEQVILHDNTKKEKKAVRSDESDQVFNKIALIRSIIEVESKNNKFAYNKAEDAVSFLQIRKVFVKDVNRILKYKLKSDVRFTYKDRWDSVKSVNMFLIYHTYYTPDWNMEKVTRIHNGGPDGHLQASTLEYYNKVKTIYNSIR